MEYADFELQLGPRAGDRLHVRVLRSPAGAGGIQVPFAPLLGLAGETRRRPLAEVGATLFRTLFDDEVGNLFHASLPQDETGLRLRLRFDPRDPDLAALHEVPWEMLYRQATEDFLALDPATPVVRTFDVARRAALPAFAPPLHLLAVSGSQDPDRPLNLAAELDGLETTLRVNREIEVEPLPDPDPQALRFALTRRPFHALHYMGHGVFDPASGEGALLCRGSDGGQRPVAGRHLATKLKGLGSLRLVVLNACETARAGDAAGRDPFAGVASALVLEGVPAVVAMRRPIDDEHALAFSSAFYDRLAHGLSIEEAVAEGRQAIFSQCGGDSDWSVPVLFLRTPSGDLFRTARQATGEPGPSTPPRGLRKGRVTVASAVGLAGALAIVGWTGWERLQGPQETPEILGTEPGADSTPAPSPPESKPTPTPRPAPPPPARSTRTVSVGDGDGLLRFRITADARVAAGFADALRSAAEPLPGFGLGGQTVRVDIQTPEIERSTEAGLPAVRCRLSATCRLESGATVRIAPLSLEQGSEAAACEAAAEELARMVADRLASST